MSVLVDTSAWSLVLRRRNSDSKLATILRDLMIKNRVRMIGPVRQEILSGVKEISEFHNLSSVLRAFPDQVLETSDYELAAAYFNKCRGQGIQGSHIDFLICAAAVNYQWEILAVDDDFAGFSRVLPIRLHRTNLP